MNIKINKMLALIVSKLSGSGEKSLRERSSTEKSPNVRSPNVRNISEKNIIMKLIPSTYLDFTKFKNKINIKINKKYAAVLCIIVLLAVISMVNSEETTDFQLKIKKSEHGSEPQKYQFDLYREGDEQKYYIEYELGPRSFRQEEVYKNFDQAYQYILEKVKGKNNSLEHVTENLDFITEIPEYDIEVSWKSENYNIINYNGEVLNDDFENNNMGQNVLLEVEFTYNKYSMTYPIKVCVFSKVRDDSQEFVRKVTDAIKNAEDEDRYSDFVNLPDTIEGKAVYFKIHKDNPITAFFTFALVGAAFIGVAVRIEKNKQQKMREQEMKRDYPEIVSKLTLLAGAGMTIGRAWEKLAQDYDLQLKSGKCRKSFAYDEILAAYYQMKSGISEINAYVNFGRACNIKEYLKLSSLLEQNLKKGTKGMAKILEAESEDAFEERKNAAKRLGEEAGTKLLIPMGLMLIVVMVIVIVPAMLSFNI